MDTCFPDFSLFTPQLISETYITVTILSTSYALILGHYSSKYNVSTTEINEHFRKIWQPIRAVVAIFTIYPISSSIGTRIFQSQAVGLAIVVILVFGNIFLAPSTFSVALETANKLYLGLVLGISFYLFLTVISLLDNIRQFIVMYRD